MGDKIYNRENASFLGMPGLNTSQWNFPPQASLGVQNNVFLGIG